MEDYVKPKSTTFAADNASAKLKAAAQIEKTRACGSTWHFPDSIARQPGMNVAPSHGESKKARLGAPISDKAAEAICRSPGLGLHDHDAHTRSARSGETVECEVGMAGGYRREIVAFPTDTGELL